MLATFATPYLPHIAPRMSGSADWDLQQAYYAQIAQSQTLRRSNALQLQSSSTGPYRKPVNSLDFFDFSAQSNDPPQTTSHDSVIQHSQPASRPDIARTISNISRTGVQGHARSESLFSADSFDDEEDQYEREDGAAWSNDQAESADSATSKRKMKRFRLTHKQTRFLTNEFLKQPHPDAVHREYLSKEIPGLSPRQVQVWFQNRRAKLKRLSVDDRERILRAKLRLDDSFSEKSPQMETLRRTMSTPSQSSTNAYEPETTRFTPSQLMHTGCSSDKGVSPGVPSAPRSNVSQQYATVRRTTKVRRETALIFGREVELYIDDETGSELAEDTVVSPVLSHESLMLADSATMNQDEDTNELQRSVTWQPQHNLSWQADIAMSGRRNSTQMPINPVGMGGSWHHRATESDTSTSLAHAWYLSQKMQQNQRQ